MDALGLIMTAAINSSVSNIQICSAYVRKFTGRYNNDKGARYDPADGYEQLDIPSGAKNIGVISRVVDGVETFRTLAPLLPNSEKGYSAYTKINLLLNTDMSFNLNTSDVTVSQYYYIKKDTNGGVYVRGYFYARNAVNGSESIPAQPMLFVLFYD